VSRRRKVDANQAELVRDLRQIGCSVALLHMVGGGVPDLLVGIGGRNYLVEVKDGSKAPSARKLTPAQVEFHRDWRGSVHVLSTRSQALEWAASMKVEC
jgi:hypothetical protein